MTSPPNDDAFECLRFERDGDVLVVTIDAPGDDLNKVNDRLHHEFTALFPRLQAERDARAVLLAGTEAAFSAGGDFDWFPQLQEPGRLEDLRLDARQMIFDLLDVHLPVVCAVTGHAMGLGASIALLCDVVVMADTARLGDPLTAADAERLGLVAETAPDAESCRAAGLAWARRLAAGAPLAVQYTKQAINAWVRQTSGSAFEHASALEIVTFGSDDHAEALAALAEKREPRFTGR